jgi:hypothetical protein
MSEFVGGLSAALAARTEKLARQLTKKNQVAWCIFRSLMFI